MEDHYPEIILKTTTTSGLLKHFGHIKLLQIIYPFIYALVFGSFGFSKTSFAGPISIMLPKYRKTT